jgi:hypothetical protein
VRPGTVVLPMVRVEHVKARDVLLRFALVAGPRDGHEYWSRLEYKTTLRQSRYIL